MSLTVGELVGYLDIDDSKFNTKADAAGQKFTGLGSTFGKMASVVAGSVVTERVVDFMHGAADSASDLNESLSKSQVVFGDSAKGVEDFASRAATSMGMSKQQALEASGTFGNLMVALGLGQQPAADMSTSLVQLAGDLASFNNVDPTEALEALRSGLTGETEPLKRFGVNMNEATLKAKAMQLGLSDGKGTLDASAKAQAAYALILDQTKTAQGDYARTSTGLANGQRTLNAVFGDVKATLGQALVPVLSTVVGWISKLLGWFTNLPGPVQKVIGIVGMLAAGLAGVGMVVAPLLSALPILGTVFGALLGPVGLVVAAIAAVVAIVVVCIKYHEQIKDAIVTAWNAVVGALKTAGKAVYDAVVQPLIDAWNWVLDNVVRPISNFFTDTVVPGLKGAWEKVTEAVTGVFRAAWTWLSENIIKPIANFFTDTVVPALKGAFQAVYDWVIKPYVDAWNWVYDNVVLPVAHFFTDTVIPAFDDAYQAVKDAVTGAFSAAWDWLKTNVVDPIKNFWTTTVVPAFEAAYEAVKNAITAPFKAAWDWINTNLIQPVKSFFSWLEGDHTVGNVTYPGNVDVGTTPTKGGSYTYTIPGLTKKTSPSYGHVPMAAGGIVTRPTLALVGEAGPEAVVPLGRFQRQIGPITIYITGQGTAAGEAAGDALIRKLSAAGVRL